MFNVGDVCTRIHQKGDESAATFIGQDVVITKMTTSGYWFEKKSKSGIVTRGCYQQREFFNYNFVLAAPLSLENK